ncbi:hypothetical protein THIOKS11770034 [Thiocapsa sp. KS1]|nr:hypothetical protein THIOKS11770034 [Thiocapsa sp. KS1]
MAGKTRELALFNPAIDSNLRGCDLVALRARDIAHGNHVIAWTSVVQHKTREPVRFELTDQTREAVQTWIKEAALSNGDYLFPSRQSGSPHLSARQYARIVKRWIGLIGADPQEYGTHSLRRNQGDVDRPSDQETARPPAAAGASQDRKHRARLGSGG